MIDLTELKSKKYTEQDGRCAGCGERFYGGEVQELAHVIPQRKWIILKYGKEIIHHPSNMMLTHTGDCNSAVQISPNKTVLLEKHIDRIRIAIEEKR